MSKKARSCYEEFLGRYKAQLKKIEKVPLVILVWGPGPGGGDLYDKRLQIRELLRSLGHVALFSEEINTGPIPPGLSARDLEECQAHEAHCIIAIQGSPGSIGEVHDFAGLMDIGHKILIFIDESAQDGYSYKGALQELKQRYTDCVETFNYPKDIKECNLVNSVLSKVRKLQITEWRSRLRK